MNGGVMIEGKKAPRMLQLSGVDVGLPEVIVQTPSKQFNRMCKTTSKADANLIFRRVWENIKKVDVDKAYAEQGEEWKDLLDDICLFYACRFVLFKKPAPVIIDE